MGIIQSRGPIDLIHNAGIGKGPFISIHDGFFVRSVDMFPNVDRLAIDTQPYLAFAIQSCLHSLAPGLAMSTHLWVSLA